MELVLKPAEEKRLLSAAKKYATTTKKLAELEASNKADKEALMQLFEEYGIKSWDNEFLKVTRVEASQSTSIDLKRLETKEPDLYSELLNDYPKTTIRKSYIRISVKR